MDEQFHKVKIVERSGAANFVSGVPVTLDGFALQGVTGYTYDAAMDRAKTLTITILVDDITIETLPAEPE